MIEADLAPVRDLRLRTCVDGTCRTDRVALAEGTSAGPESCSGTGADAACAVEMTPDGTQHGFLELDLPEGPVEVSGSYRVDSRSVRLGPATITAEVSYPNGPDCGTGGTQGQVSIGPAGIG